MGVHATGTEPAAPKARRRGGGIGAIRRSVPLYIMFVPGVVFYLLFKYYPLGGLVIAFKDYNMYDGILKSPWVGLDNFRMLFNQAQTVQIIGNTLLLSVLGIAIGFPVPILLAVMLNEVRRTWFKRFVQTLVYLPHFFSWVIVSGIVLEMFSQESGIINHWVAGVFGEPYPFLYKPLSWLAVFIGSGVWKEMGFSAIIYLAALTAIDPHLYESASIDGASKWKQIRHVSIPGIMPTIALLLILQVGKVMDVGFDPVYMLSNESVSSVANVISTYNYSVGIQRAQFSLTTAMGLFENAVGFVLVTFANRIGRRFNQQLW
ncbi:ABC transporter permease [Paenibacillus glycinis]|uniref:ABC transporter permease subunit n=1 Tax=Paenibacillus glycinis TaxID=2697035 RepID=A0ABW9XPV5_9BACL|nr:ABC transporter permease subunit [Paenibacillus glycinis]